MFLFQGLTITSTGWSSRSPSAITTCIVFPSDAAQEQKAGSVEDASFHGKLYRIAGHAVGIHRHIQSPRHDSAWNRYVDLIEADKAWSETRKGRCGDGPADPHLGSH